MASVERLESALPRWPPSDGYPGWILPIQQDGVTRGLGCKDLTKLEDADRAVACAADKAYAPNLDTLVYPSNTPVALMSVGGKTVAFMMGHHACPMQCDDDVLLSPTYEVYRGVNMMVQPDGSVTVIDMTNGKKRSFESRAALEESNYFRNTVASRNIGNIDENMGKELENLEEVRKSFAELGSKGRSSTLTNLWEAGTGIPPGDETAPIVAKAFENDCSTESTWATDQTLPGDTQAPVELTVVTECGSDLPKSARQQGPSDLGTTTSETEGPVDFQNAPRVVLSPEPGEISYDIDFQTPPRVQLRPS